MISFATLLFGFFILGCAAGACHFLLLRRTVDLLVGRGHATAVLAVQLGRLAITAGALTLAASQGWAPLLSCAAGLLVAKQVVVRHLGRAGA